MDGNRAYAAVLSGYTVALIAIQQLDTPQHVFESGVARGAAIAVGIAAVAFVNDLLAAPDSFPRLASQLAALHARVRDYAKPVPRDEATDAATAAGLLRDIAALRPEIDKLGHGVGERLDPERGSSKHGRCARSGGSCRPRPERSLPRQPIRPWTIRALRRCGHRHWPRPRASFFGESPRFAKDLPR